MNLSPHFSSLSPDVHSTRENHSPQTAKWKSLKANNYPTASGTLENWRKKWAKTNFPLKSSNEKLINFVKNFIYPNEF